MTSLDPDYLPSLHYNGALNPDNWRPDSGSLRDNSWGCRRLEEGDLVAWRYAGWRVHRIIPYQDYDLTDQQRAKVDKILKLYKPERQAEFMPYHAVLRHEVGPLVLKDGESPFWKTLHDGTRELSVTSWPHKLRWHRLPEPYQVCSCHGHPWPCQDRDQAVLTAHQIKRMDRLMATAQPGVCAHCLEPISTRQKTLTFPEPSRFVPGAPGPTFHAGRGECWAGAERYEREGRLADNPGVARVASCPGIRFMHQRHGMPTGKRIDCTAGVYCTGIHGPAGYRSDVPCDRRVHLPVGDGDPYAWPTFDCGYRSGGQACLASTPPDNLGSSINETAADLLWMSSNRHRSN